MRLLGRGKVARSFQRHGQQLIRAARVEAIQGGVKMLPGLDETLRIQQGHGGLFMTLRIGPAVREDPVVKGQRIVSGAMGGLGAALQKAGHVNGPRGSHGQ